VGRMSNASGLEDAFVRKYDASGNLLATRQFGDPFQSDTATGVAVDGTGSVYVAGYTFGALPGQTSAGGTTDAFVRKYDASLNEVWTRQFGTGGFDEALDVAVDGAGNVYVVGLISTVLPDWDAFVRKYDAAGNLWVMRQFGTLPPGKNFSPDAAEGVVVDGTGHVYVAGSVSDALPGQTSASPGLSDAFVRKYDASLNEVWTRQFGTSENDSALGVTVDGTGSVYVAGYTFGALPGQTSAGFVDAFVREYDAGGSEMWTNQFGTPGQDYAQGVAADVTGNVYAVGRTEGTLPGQTSAGGFDAFVVKLSEITVIPVAIDINPASSSNTINPRSRAQIPVAILTTTSFDAATVDPATVRFGRTGTEAPPSQFTLVDVDADGDSDLVLLFNIQKTGIACGDTSASLTGETVGGEAIEGSDSIQTIGCR